MIEHLPSRREVIRHLKVELQTWESSYTDHTGPSKGKVTNPVAVKAIRHLRAAINYLNESPEVRGRGQKCK
jgi:hypothetical protein